jgi:hypothetical protein
VPGNLLRQTLPEGLGSEGTVLSGRILSDAILAHVQDAYPRDRVFHYEVAKEQMLAKGIRIKGPVTGRTMRSSEIDRQVAGLVL